MSMSSTQLMSTSPPAKSPCSLPGKIWYRPQSSLMCARALTPGGKKIMSWVIFPSAIGMVVRSGASLVVRCVVLMADTKIMAGSRPLRRRRRGRGRGYVALGGIQIPAGRQVHRAGVGAGKQIDGQELRRIDPLVGDDPVAVVVGDRLVDEGLLKGHQIGDSRLEYAGAPAFVVEGNPAEPQARALWDGRERDLYVGPGSGEH